MADELDRNAYESGTMRLQMIGPWPASESGEVVAHSRPWGTMVDGDEWCGDDRAGGRHDRPP